MTLPDQAWNILHGAPATVSTADVGWALWGGGRARTPRRANKFCRKAGQILQQLVREGRARAIPMPGCTHWQAVEQKENEFRLS